MGEVSEGSEARDGIKRLIASPVRFAAGKFTGNYRRRY